MRIIRRRLVHRGSEVVLEFHDAGLQDVVLGALPRRVGKDLGVVTGELVEPGEEVGLRDVVELRAEREPFSTLLLVALGPQPGDLGAGEGEIGRIARCLALWPALGGGPVGLPGSVLLDRFSEAGGVDEPGGDLGLAATEAKVIGRPSRSIFSTVASTRLRFVVLSWRRASII